MYFNLTKVVIFLAYSNTRYSTLVENYVYNTVIKRKTSTIQPSAMFISFEKVDVDVVLNIIVVAHLRD